jgi:hypothetical protein
MGMRSKVGSVTILLAAITVVASDASTIIPIARASLLCNLGQIRCLETACDWSSHSCSYLPIKSLFIEANLTNDPPRQPRYSSCGNVHNTHAETRLPPAWVSFHIGGY